MQPVYHDPLKNGLVVSSVRDRAHILNNPIDRRVRIHHDAVALFRRPGHQFSVMMPPSKQALETAQAWAALQRLRNSGTALQNQDYPKTKPSRRH